MPTSLTPNSLWRCTTRDHHGHLRRIVQVQTAAVRVVTVRPRQRARNAQPRAIPLRVFLATHELERGAA